MTYIVLITILLFMVLMTYVVFKKDSLSPTFISCVAFLCCSFLGFIGLHYWNNQSDLSYRLIIIISMGLMAFFFGEIVARKLIKIVDEKVVRKKINISKKLYYITIFFVIMTIFLLIIEIKKICNFYNFYSHSIPELLAFYRGKMELFDTALATDGLSINFFVKQMKKMCDVICVIWMYILLNNYFIQKNKKELIKNSIPIILCLLSTLMTSGRSLLMHRCVSFIIMYLIFMKIYFSNKQNGKKVLLTVFAFGVCTLSIFYLVLPLVGRKTNSNPVEYFSFYLGTPIPSFNVYLNSPSTKKNIYIGEETFNNIYQTLNRFHIIDYKKAKTHNWIQFSKFSSNVFTSFRCYYNDFGIMGVIILQFVAGFMITAMYLNVLHKKKPIMVIIYSYYGYMLIDQIRDEQFFNLISSSTFVYLILIVAMYYIYIKGVNYKPKLHTKRC